MLGQTILAVVLGAVLTVSNPVVAFHVQDTAGKLHTPAEWKGKTAILFFFVASDCPVSNSYVPEMNRIAQEYAARGVFTLAVLPESEISLEAAKTYAREYHFAFPVLLDRSQDLVRLAGATVTPEAAILSPTGKVLYRGRIDNRLADFGSQRRSATEHDTRAALEAVVAGHLPAVQFTRSIGCAITMLKRNQR